MRDEVRGSYEAGAAGWDDGPARLYRALAEVLVAEAAARVGLDGAAALDVGAGTGVVSAVLAERGATVVATDFALAMLGRRRHERPPAAAGDATALPLRSDAFDAVVGGCVVNHLPDPGPAVAEAARVARPGGVVAFSTFEPGHDHPAKAAVDGVLARFGFEAPEWYVRFKAEVEPLTGDPAVLRAVGEGAGLQGVAVARHEVDSGLRTPEEVAGWRLGMATSTAFLASLPPERAAEARAAAAEAVGPHPPPVAPVLLVLAGTAPG